MLRLAPMRTIVLMLAVIVCGLAFASAQGKPGKPGVTRAPFGKVPDGRTVEVFTLTNARGLEVQAITYGAIITSLRVPDRNGTPGDIVLGFDGSRVTSRVIRSSAAIVGRYANRIAGGKFTLDGADLHTGHNNGPNHLHGGKVGFDKAVWAAEPCRQRGRGRVCPHESRWRGRLSGHAEGARHLHAHRQERARQSTITPRPTSRRP